MVNYYNFYVDLIKYAYISAAELYLGNPKFGLKSKTNSFVNSGSYKALLPTTCVLQLIYCFNWNILRL